MDIHSNSNLLLFGLEEKLFAIPLTAVERVVRAVEVTAMPGAGSALLGAINVNNRAIPVVNPYHYFDLPAKEIEPSHFMILMNLEQRQFALLVQCVPGVAGDPSPEADSNRLDNGSQQTVSARDELSLNPMDTEQTSKSSSTSFGDIRILDGQIVILVEPAALLHKIDEASPDADRATDAIAPNQQWGQHPIHG